MVGIILSLLFGYLAFRNVDARKFINAFHSVNYWWIVPTVCLSFLGFVIRAVRWRYMMMPVKTIGFGKIFSAMMVSYLAVNILPARVGEIVRAYAIKKSSQVSGSAALATVIIERLLDLLMVILFIYSISYLVPKSVSSQILQISHLLLLFIIGVFIIFLMLVKKRDATVAFLQKLLQILPRKLAEISGDILYKFIRGLDVLIAAQHYGQIVFTTFCMWFFYTLSYYLSFRIFDFHLPLTAGLVVIAMSGIGMMIPAAPGAIGTFHWFTMQALLLYGIAHDQASSYVVLIHAVNFIYVSAIGLVCLLRENIRLAEARMSDIDDT